MALVHNKGLRGFILKSGILEAGKIANLDENEAQKLAGMYPNEIEIIKPQPVVEKAPEAQAPVQEPKQEEVKEEKAPEKAKAQVKKGSKK